MQKKNIVGCKNVKRPIFPVFFFVFVVFSAKKKDGKSVGFLWSQGGDQFELEEVQIGVNEVIESHSKYEQNTVSFFLHLKRKGKMKTYVILHIICNFM